MCGICGIFTFERSCGSKERDLLKAMNGRLLHRGPDEEGLHIAGPIALGHRRLSIIDLSNGQQPMSNEDGTVWVVFNGEIYNHQALRSGLAGSHHFRTRSDTEVIVHLYEEIGERVFERLNGMFAIGLWDARAKKLILARDRMGKKPLYYHVTGERLAFASEMKALLVLRDFKLQPNLESLDRYLSFFYVPAPETAFAGISKLEPATYLVCQDGKTRKERYWNVDFGRRYSGNEQQAAGDLIDLIHDAVKIRLESEVPLGAFLSGGIDSSAVVASMSQFMQQPVKTTAIGFAERGFNELDHARVVAGHFRTDHREHTLKPHFIEHLPRIVYHLDEPFADASALPTYLLCRATREHVTVALSGDGGDENFAGYERYLSALHEEQWRSFVPAPLRLLALHLAGQFVSPLWRGYTRLRNLNQDLPTAMARTFFCFSDDLKQDLYAPGFRRKLQGSSATERFLEAFPGQSSGWPSLSRLQAFDLASYLPEDILTKVDRMSMAHSLEVRAPLLDYRLVELAASMPPDWKLDHGQGKLILKKALSSFLPPEVLQRKKMGFSVPLGDWFRRDWRSLGENIILGQRLRDRGYFEPAAVKKLWDSHQQQRPWRLDLGPHLWALLVLELWHRLFVDGETIEQLTEELAGINQVAA
jgi:asparagine synthase (glutamine-hydrolysing)